LLCSLDSSAENKGYWPVILTVLILFVHLVALELLPLKKTEINKASSLLMQVIGGLLRKRILPLPL